MRQSASILGILIFLVLGAAVVAGIVAVVMLLCTKKSKPAETREGSYFDGGYLAYIGYSILVSFVSGITFGIAAPWMLCMMMRWMASHTVVSSKRMRFDGTGTGLFGRYILWSFLTVITFGIFGLWMGIFLAKWMVKNLHFEGEEDDNSYFDGGVVGLIGTALLSCLVALVPFVGGAWATIVWTRWATKHTVVDSRRLCFVGTVGDLFVKYLIWGILTTITLGIYGLFVPVKSIRWQVENTVDHEHTAEANLNKNQYEVQLHNDATSFKTFAVESEMESVKSGIVDSITAEELLTLANGGSRSAQYEYVARCSGGEYAYKEPYRTLLKNSADAGYIPAVYLYATLPDIDEATRRTMLKQAADGGQKPAIRDYMVLLANNGLSLPENANALATLKEAKRYADLYELSGETLTEQEAELIKKCLLMIRRIESAAGKPAKSGAVAIIAVVAAAVVLLGAGSAMVALLFAPATFRSDAPQTMSVALYDDNLEDLLQIKLAAAGFAFVEVREDESTGIEYYAVSNTQFDSSATVAIKSYTNGYGEDRVSHITITASKDTGKQAVEATVKSIYHALQYYDVDEVSTYLSSGEVHGVDHHGWNITYNTAGDDINVYVSQLETMATPAEKNSIW